MSAFERFKKLLGIEDNDKDFVLQFALDKARDLILNYCNVVEIPKGLENVLLNIAIDIYRTENLGNEEMLQQVTSIKRGDTATQFSTTTVNDNTQPGTMYLTRYLYQLNAYRRARWRL